MEDNKYEEIKPGELVLTGGSEYVKVDDGEPYKAHVARVNKVQGKNFTTGEPEMRLAVGFELDESDGKGQIYTNWYNPSLNPKSKFADLLLKLTGSLPEKIDVVDLLGLPLRLTVVTREKDGIARQYVDTLLAPAKDQVKVEIKQDVAPKDLPDEDKIMAELDKVFEGKVEVENG